MNQRVIFFVSLTTLVFLVWLLVTSTPHQENSNVKKQVTPSFAHPNKILATKHTKMVSNQFEDAFKELPTFDDAYMLNEEDVHGTPEIVLKGGHIVGELEAQANEKPEIREETLAFFLKCAEAEEVLSAVRAVCWNSLTTKIVDWNLFVPVADSDVPEEIRLLASRLKQ